MVSHLRIFYLEAYSDLTLLDLGDTPRLPSGKQLHEGSPWCVKLVLCMCDDFMRKRGQNVTVP